MQRPRKNNYKVRWNKNWWFLGLIGGSATLMVGVLCWLTSFGGASALTRGGNVNVNFTTQNAIAISAPETVTMEFMPDAVGATTNTFHTVDATVKVSTSNPTGYTLSMNSSEANNTSLAGPNGATIATLAGDNITIVNFPINNWGYSLNYSTDTSAYALFNAVKASEVATSSTIARTSGPAAEDETIVTFGVKADTSLPAGDYSSTLTWTAVANQAPPSAQCNPSATEIADAVCMQDINSDIKESMAAGATYTLMDSRDGNFYTVAKLNDWNVWMTANLDLNLSTTTTLTSNDTNLVSVDSWTPIRSTIPQNQLSSSTWIDDNNTPYSYDSPTAGYGNYYNWSAAVASNDTSSIVAEGTNVANSVCPKGWRLPNFNTQEFRVLSYKHNVIGALTSTQYTTNGLAILMSAPLNFIDVGIIGSNSGFAFDRSFYWTGQVYTASAACDWGFFTDRDLTAQGCSTRSNGFSVRCVAE